MLKPSVKVELSLTVDDGLTEGRGIADGSPLSMLGPLATTLRPTAASDEANRPVVSIRAKLRHKSCWFGDDADKNWHEVMAPWLYDASRTAYGALERIDGVRDSFGLAPLKSGIIEWHIDPFAFCVDGSEVPEVVCSFVEEFRQRFCSGAFAEVSGQEAHGQIARVALKARRESRLIENEGKANSGDEEMPSETAETPYWLIELADGATFIWDLSTARLSEGDVKPEQEKAVELDATEEAELRLRAHALAVNPLRYGTICIPAAGASALKPAACEAHASACTQHAEHDSGEVEAKLEALDCWIAQRPGLVVGFSGGPASFVLARHARKVLGASATIVFADHPFISQDRRFLIDQFRQELGVVVVSHQGLCSRETRIGSADCCYSCRYHLYESLIDLAGDASRVAIGEAKDVLCGLGRGHQALRELSVETPLAEVGLTRAELVEAASAMGFDAAVNADVSCVIDRLPFGHMVDEGAACALAALEDDLRHAYGISSLRVLVAGDRSVRVDIDPALLRRYLHVDEGKRIDYPELTRLAREWPHVKTLLLGEEPLEPNTLPLGEMLSDIVQRLREAGYGEVYFEDAIAQRVRES